MKISFTLTKRDICPEKSSDGQKIGVTKVVLSFFAISVFYPGEKPHRIFEDP